MVEDRPLAPRRADRALVESSKPQVSVDLSGEPTGSGGVGSAMAESRQKTRREPDEVSLGDRAAHAVLEYREGRPAALEAVVREMTPLLWHTVRAQGVEPQAADDVVQDTWVALVRHMDTIAEPHAVLKWLLVTARRGAWEAVRRRRRDEKNRTELHDGPDPETGAHREVPSADPTPDTVAATNDRDRTLWTVFQDLPARCRELLRLVSLADRPDYKHISEAIGMPVGSIGATRGRCLAKLRTLLDESGADDTWRHA